MSKFEGPGIIESLSIHAIEVPQKQALIFLYPDKKAEIITYSQLEEDTSNYSHRLRSAGICPGDLVILIFDHSYEMVSAFLGAIHLGAIPSIFPYFSSNSSHGAYEGRVKDLVVDVDPRAIITEPEFKNELSQLLKDTDCQIIDLQDASIKKSTSEKYLPPSPTDIAYIQFSSGTTGLSKGTMLSHHAVNSHSRSLAKNLNFCKKGVNVGWLPLNHDMGLVTQLLIPLLLGAQSIFISPFYWVRRPRILFQAIHDYQATLTAMPNFAFRHSIRCTRPAELKGLDLSSLHSVFSGSEPVQSDCLHEFVEYFKPYGLSSKAISVGYGMAEVVLEVSQTPMNEFPEIDWISLSELQIRGKAVPVSPESKGSKSIVSCGYPKFDTIIAIVNDEGAHLGDRELGEIIVQCPTLFSGYYNKPKETRQAIRKGWYYTGDIGYTVKGQLYVCDRKKDLIIVGGQNIYPDHIEVKALEILGENAGEIVAFGIKNEKLGTELPILVCELRRIQKDIKKEKLAQTIKQEILHFFGIVLTDVYFVKRGWIIKTTSGKIGRAANRQKYQDENIEATPKDQLSQRALEQIKLDKNFNILQPEEQYEQLSAFVCAQLRLIMGSENLAHLDEHTNLFDLGMNSLFAGELNTRLSRALDYQLPLSIMFDYPSIVTLVAFILKEFRAPKTPPLVESKRFNKEITSTLFMKNKGPLSFIQEKYWQHRQLEANDSFFNLTFSLHFQGILDKRLLELSLNKVIQRHESLRTTFKRQEGEMVQVINQSFTIEIPVIEIAAGPQEEQFIETKNLVIKAKNIPFDLEKGPLFWMKLFRLKSDSNILSIGLHHVISDVWSFKILASELFELYRSYQVKVPSSLPMLASQYIDFTRQQRESISQESFNSKARYWQTLLSGNTKPISFPFDYPPSGSPAFNAARTHFTLSPDVIKRLEKIRHNEKISMFMLILPFYAILLYRWTGCERINIGAPVSNRNRNELAPLIGSFASIMLLPFELSGQISFIELLKRTKEVVLEAVQNQDLPFEYWTQHLDMTQGFKNKNPWQVIFNYMADTPALPEKTDFKELTVKPVLKERTMRMPINLITWQWEKLPEGKALSCWLQYREDLFTPETIAKLAKNFQIIVETASRNPNILLSELPFR